MARRVVTLVPAVVVWMFAMACALDTGSVVTSGVGGVSLPPPILEAVEQCVSDLAAGEGGYRSLRVGDGYVVAVKAGDPASPGIVWVTQEDGGWSCKDTSFFGFPLPEEAGEETVRLVTLALDQSMAVLTETGGGVDVVELVGRDGTVLAQAYVEDGIGLLEGPAGSALVSYTDGAFVTATPLRTPSIEVPPFEANGDGTQVAARFVDGLLAGAPPAELVVHGDEVDELLATLQGLVESRGFAEVLEREAEWFGYTFVLRGAQGCARLLLFMSGSNPPMIGSYEMRASDCPSSPT